MNSIHDAIEAGAMGQSVNKTNGQHCTVYCYPNTGYYVVIETESRNVVQCSEYGNDEWVPDNSIIWC